MEYVYAGLLLHKLGQPINEENMKKIIAAAGAQVDEAKIKTLIASLQGVDIDKELESAALVSAAPAATVATEKETKEAAEEEEKKEEAAEGLSALFG